MPLEVAAGISIPDEALSVSFVRGTGPGGQNVNKVATAAQLRLELARSGLSEEVKARLRELAGRRLSGEDTLQIVARTQRTQEHNRREALARLAELVRRALHVPKPRTKTRPTRASRERRLEHKAHQQRTKRLRGRPRFED
jgi:ribosome-associated protein